MERNKIIAVAGLAIGLVAWRIGAMQQGDSSQMVAVITKDKHKVTLSSDQAMLFPTLQGLIESVEDPEGFRNGVPLSNVTQETLQCLLADLPWVQEVRRRMQENESEEKAARRIAMAMPRIDFDGERLAQLLEVVKGAVYLGQMTLLERYARQIASMLRSDASMQQLVESNNSTYLAMIRKLLVLPDSLLKGIANNMELWVETATLRGHNSGVCGIAWNPDGAEIGTISYDHRAIIWNAQTGKQSKMLDCPNQVCAISFSPDGKKVITAECDGTNEKMTVITWDASNGKKHLALEVAPYTDPDLDDQEVAIIKLKDNRKVAKTFTNFDMAYLNLNRARQLKTLNGHTDEIIMAEYSPTGRMIATVSWDRTARLWSENGKLLRTLDGHNDGVFAVAFSPDESQVATASRDGTLRIWHVQTGTLLQTLRVHQVAVNSVAYCQDGSKLVTASKDCTAKIWDAHEGVLLQVLIGHTEEVLCAAFSPKGDAVATGSRDRTAKIFRKLPQSLPLTASLGAASELEAILFVYLIVWASQHNQKVSNMWARGIANNIAWDRVESVAKRELQKLIRETM